MKGPPAGSGYVWGCTFLEQISFPSPNGLHKCLACSISHHRGHPESLHGGIPQLFDDVLEGCERRSTYILGIVDFDARIRGS